LWTDLLHVCLGLPLFRCPWADGLVFVKLALQILACIAL